MDLSATEVSILRSDNLKRNKEKVTAYYLDKIDNYPSFASLNDFEVFILQGLTQANRYGLITQYSLHKFVAMTLIHTSQFDESPEIRRMLADEMMDDDDKVDVVCRELS